jgi:nucleotide-binding universal stress UspA family protein
MISKLLACTDGSLHGDVVCDYSVSLAKALKAQVRGLHVLDVRMIEGPLLGDVSGLIGAGEYFAALPQFRQLTEEKGRVVRQAFEKRALDAGMEVTCDVETGHPVHAILARQDDTDLLVLGQRGENEQFGRELLGSVTDRIVRRTHKPCLVTPAQFNPIDRILAACDGGPISGKVAALAASLAAALAKPLTIVSVADKTDLAAMREVALKEEKAALTHGCEAHAVVRSGMASDIILEVASDTHAGLIVMGAHSHTRIREWFVGCHTVRILADSAVPALLVR